MNLISLKAIRITLTSSLLILAACGGSGGGTPAPAETNYYQTPVAVNSFQLLSGVGEANADIYKVDLNNNGVDEFIIAGSKNNSPDAWQSFNIQVFGWKNGTLQNITSDWSPGLTTGAGMVRFGDFDKNGYMDVAIAPSTDNNTTFSETLVLFNNGTSFTRSIINPASDQIWSHDLAVADFNEDTYLDILITDYGVPGKTTLFLNTADGNQTFTKYQTTGYSYTGASGVAVGNFDGSADGKAEILMTDSGGGSQNSTTIIDDTRLFKWSTSGSDLILTVQAVTTPTSPYTLTEGNAQTHSKAHAIRVIPFNLAGDSDLDAVVFERLDSESTVQFMENDGNGNFTEVNILVNYSTAEGGVNYNPTVFDYNGDGLLDILSTGSDFTAPLTYTQILLQSSDGKFVASYSNIFTQFTTDILNKEKVSHAATTKDSGYGTHIVEGPNSEFYIVSLVMRTDGVATVYSAKLGAKDSIAPQTSAELQSNVWPY